MVFYRISPFGETRADLRSSSIIATMMNIMRDGKLHPDPYTAMDFMPFLEREEPDPKEIAKRTRTIFQGIINRQKKAATDGGSDYYSQVGRSHHTE